MRRRSAALALIAVAGLLAVGWLSASAFGGVVSLNMPPSVEISGKTSPLKLPKATPKPITLHLKGVISEPSTGARPPALQALTLRFDKSGSIFTKGLETCKWNPISEFTIVQACQKALVGHGEFEIEVEVPEQPAFYTEAPMRIYNGPPQDGHPVLIYEAYAHVPAPTTFLVSGVIEKAHGKFGTQTTIPIPTFVSHYGSLVGFRAEIGKSWKYKGKKVSLFSGDCRTGSLVMQDGAEFVNGDELGGELIQPCTPR